MNAKKKSIVDPKTVRLVEGKGGKELGAVLYWHIYVEEKRAGYVCILPTDHPVFGNHLHIKIWLNKNCQGKNIGRIGYELACKQSSYKKIYAHMKKSNIASKKAAEYAGFKMIDDSQQLTMLWEAEV